MFSAVAERRDSAHVPVFGSSSGFEGALVLIPEQRKRAVDSAVARDDSAPSIPVLKALRGYARCRAIVQPYVRDLLP